MYNIGQAIILNLNCTRAFWHNLFTLRKNIDVRDSCSIFAVKLFDSLTARRREGTGKMGIYRRNVTAVEVIQILGSWRNKLTDERMRDSF